HSAMPAAQTTALFFAKGNIRSSNWAGYVATGAPYTDVTGSWRQPQVQCGTDGDAFASFWVGLGGFRARAIQQIGTGTGCVNGQPITYSWYQLLPNPPVTLNRTQYPLAPGDEVAATVSTSDGGASFALTLHSTRGWTFTTTQHVAGARLVSAECIAEAPSYGGILALADFGSIAFTHCTVDGTPIGTTAHTAALTMYAQDVIQAVPSWLTPSGDAFTILRVQG
ncbi:MAG: hypothetical protein H0X24_24720, partial [Ktedonobacterales bacterium]|nr:hypothetical protein [Ktedonobacterales bacterium]